MGTSFWSQDLSDPASWVGIRAAIRRVIGLYGGILAVGVTALFWILVWCENHFTWWSGPLAWVLGPLYVLYVSLPLSIPVIGFFASRNSKHGEQSQMSGVLQMALALAATTISWWTIGKGFVELP